MNIDLLLCIFQMAAVPVFVSIKQGVKSVMNRTVMLVPKVATYEDLLTEFLSRKINIDSVDKISIMTVGNEKNRIEVSSLNLPLSTGLDIGYNAIDIMMKIDEQTDSTQPKTNAFARMMRTEFVLPPKINKEKLTSTERMENDLLSIMEELGCGWQVHNESGGKVLKAIRDVLVYIQHAHEKFADRGCKIPKEFEKFKDYKNLEKLHRKQHSITSERLTELADRLNTAIDFPSMNTNRNKKLQ